MQYFLTTIVIITGLVINEKINKKKETHLNFDHMQESSFQKFAKFFGKTTPKDEEYMNKLNAIFDLIVNQKEEKISEITKKSNCATKEECVLKIRYLKNKKMLDDYYIDVPNDEILKCNKEDQALIDKYKPYIYHSHLQINEIASVIPNKRYEGIEALREQVYKDLTYLDKKNLLNGIKIDTIDRKLIYYTIEKRKQPEGYETVHCPNCGALNDVEVNGKVRCDYCKTIIKGSAVE